MNRRNDVPVAWSPDSRRLLLKRESADGFELVVQAWPAPKEEAAIARLPHSPLGMQWSPDGTAVGFLARLDGPLFRPWIWRVGQDPVVWREAPSTAFALLAPVWHPGGQQFLYWAEGYLYVAGPGSGRRVFRGAAGQAGFAWSLDGKRIAAVGVLRPGHLQILGPEGKREALIAICPGGKIRDVRWTPQGLLVTARTARAEWYQVAKVDQSGSIEWLSDGPGDKRRPTEWTDGRIVWESHRRGMSSIWSTDGVESREGTGLPYSGYQAKGWRLEFVSPSGVVAVEERSNAPARTLPARTGWEEWQPQLVHLPSSDGVVLTAWLWEPEIVKGVVIDVHGAPHLASSPYHAPGVRHLWKNGIAVMAVNFRGSGGEGQTLEEWPGDPAEDLLAARRWLAERRPGAPVVLHGQSFGALLCLRSALNNPSDELAGVVLTSLRVPPERPVWCGWTGLPIVAFHGGWDLVAPVAETRAYLQEIAPGVRLTEFAEEGHAFHHRANRRRSYEAAAELIEKFG